MVKIQDPIPKPCNSGLNHYVKNIVGWFVAVSLSFWVFCEDMLSPLNGLAIRDISVLYVLSKRYLLCRRYHAHLVISGFLFWLCVDHQYLIFRQTKFAR
ncbi:Uncharacterised protein [Mycobacteroides abscessus subsp. abscessus]|nr:Uncharacterised protein [Mycobacteroides abscessus subsp. abscessus]